MISEGLTCPTQGSTLAQPQRRCWISVTNLALRSRALAALVGLTRIIQRWAILLLHYILSSDGKSEAHCMRIKWG